MIHRSTQQQYMWEHGYVARQEANASSGVVRVVVLGVEVIYSRALGYMAFMGPGHGDAWVWACRLAKLLGARVRAVAL